MRFTDDMRAEDEKRWHARDVVTELGYCGNYMQDRKDMTNLDIRFYAYIMRKAHEMLKAQGPIEARLNLCDSCAKLYPECDATADAIKFGCGVGNDNVIGCMEYVNRWKAQQPRLLTVDDFKNNSDVDICGYLPCWVEPNPHNDAATEKPGWGLVSVGQIGGVYHRHWTGKPTQEQMEAMKWE